MARCTICGRNGAQSRTKDGTWLCRDCVNRLGGYGDWMKRIRKMSHDEILSAINSTGLRDGEAQTMTNSGSDASGQITCPSCGSTNVSINTISENLGSTAFSTTKTKEKGHGCLWWLLVGWELWIINALTWIFMFIPRVLLHIGRKKKYVSKTTTQTMNHIVYKTICTCQNCGNAWQVKR